MNTQEYISSGILESYVLNQLTPEERKEVESMAAAHPEIKSELDAIEDALTTYAMANAKTPPTDLKKQLFAQLTAGSTKKETGKIIPIAIAKKSSGYSSWVAAASIILLIGSGIYNYILFNKLQSTEAQLSSLTSEKEYYASQFETQKTHFAQSSEQLSMIMEGNNKMVHLKGMGPAPAATAMVIWNEETKEVYINAKALPAPASDKQYQLWAIVDGKPVDAGVFEMNDSSFLPLQKMKLISGAKAFAVTLEKKGGSPNPTMETMCLLGNV